MKKVLKYVAAVIVATVVVSVGTAVGVRMAVAWLAYDVQQASNAQIDKGIIGYNSSNNPLNLNP